MAAGNKSSRRARAYSLSANIDNTSAAYRQCLRNRERRFSDYPEDAMIEQPTTIPPFSVLGWKTQKLLPERLAPGGIKCRENSAEVVPCP